MQHGCIHLAMHIKTHGVNVSHEVRGDIGGGVASVAPRRPTVRVRVSRDRSQHLLENEFVKNNNNKTDNKPGVFL